MAVEHLSSAEQMQQNYEKYRDKYTDSNAELVNQETFLKLLVAEMSNQDPLEPTSNTEFISQLATFSSMSYMQDASKYALANYATSLAGKTVTASKIEGTNAVIKTGVVEKVVQNGTNYTLTIDGETFSLSQVTSVLSGEESGDTTSAPANSALGESIARAAALVGMYVTVPNGFGTLSGWVDSIKVNDGKITAILTDIYGNTLNDGNGYNIEDITDMTIRYIVSTPIDGEEGSPDGVTDTEEPTDDLVDSPDEP